MAIQEDSSDRLLVHPDWRRTTPPTITHGYSLEVTPKDVPALRAAAALLWRAMPIAIPFLPNETHTIRIAAARTVRELGFEPMPHFSARRISSFDAFRTYLDFAVREAGAERCFVVAGDPAHPIGPFPDTAALLATGAFEEAGIRVIGIGGHPEGHPVMSSEQCWDVLHAKCEDIGRRGMAPLIVTQFVFDAYVVLDWLLQLRARGITVPVRIGVPGPASIKTLLRFAAMCGVGTSASVMARYGVSLGRLLNGAGPDKLLDTLASNLTAAHGAVRLHFYPFGGLTRTVEWIGDYDRKHRDGAR